MATRANVSKNYLVRLGIVGLVCALGSAWFLYDGLVGYPAKRERGLDFLQFVEENSELDEKDQHDQWKARAAERGWPTDNPLNEKGQALAPVDINEQFFYSAGAGLIGLGFLSRMAYMLGRWVESDGTKLRTKAGQEVEFSQITALDKKKWKSKGIAFANYDANGRKGKIRLDDYYYDRASTGTILRQIEAAIDPAKIVNGKPEPPETPSVSLEADA